MGLYNVVNRTLLQAGQAEDISQVLSNFDAIATILNGGIDPQNLRGSPPLAPGQGAAWNGSAWIPFTASAIHYTAAWSSATTYSQGDIVTYQGVTYLAVAVNTNQPPPPATGRQPTYGITPPATPADGDEWVLPADATNGVAWRFRYNATSPSAYKWEFMGGPPMSSAVPADQTTATASTWLDLATDGPAITIPRAGDYLLRGGSAMYHSAANSYVYWGFAAPGATPANAYGVQLPFGGAFTGQSTADEFAIGLAAGAIRKIRYSMQTAGTAHWLNRLLTVTPVRVS